MKFQFPLSLPNRAERTLLPTLLSAMLAATFLTQLLWADRDADLPPVMAVTAAQGNFKAPKIPLVEVPRNIFSRPLFAPRKSTTLKNDGSPPPVLGGATIAGTVSIRGRSVVVVQRPGGAVTNLTIGGALGGWRLSAIGQRGAIFVRGSERRDIAYGAPPSGAPTEEPAE